MYLNQVTKQ